MAYGLLIDYTYCSGCQSCEVACKAEHDFPVGKWGIRVFEDGPWAIDGDGNRTTKNWNWNKIPVVTKLCDMCADRVEAGREPACVHNCLGDCMKFGPIEELALELAKKPNQVLWTETA